jgi:hypothetical protein
MRKNLLLLTGLITLGYFAYDGLAKGELMRDAGSWLSRRVTRDDNPLEFVSALTQGTAYYGIQCSGTGYLDCEQTQRTAGKPIQAYRIVGTSSAMEFRIDYVGLGADLDPACDQVIVVSTTALVHPTVQIECADVDVIGTALDIDL